MNGKQTMPGGFEKAETGVAFCCIVQISRNSSVNLKFKNFSLLSLSGISGQRTGTTLVVGLLTNTDQNIFELGGKYAAVFA